jgi:uncharacterized membrane protein YhaH (DUF805 family)
MNGQSDWLELFTASTGRLGRTPFWVAGGLVLGLALLFKGVAGGGILELLIGLVAYPALLFFGANLLAKRLHDRGRSGWWAALILLAVVTVWPLRFWLFDALAWLIIAWAAVELAMMPGEQGANRYGPNPARIGQTA